MHRPESGNTWGRKEGEGRHEGMLIQPTKARTHAHTDRQIDDGFDPSYHIIVLGLHTLVNVPVCLAGIWRLLLLVVVLICWEKKTLFFR